MLTSISKGLELNVFAVRCQKRWFTSSASSWATCNSHRHIFIVSLFYQLRMFLLTHQTTLITMMNCHRCFLITNRIMLLNQKKKKQSAVSGCDEAHVQYLAWALMSSFPLALRHEVYISRTPTQNKQIPLWRAGGVTDWLTGSRASSNSDIVPTRDIGTCNWQTICFSRLGKHFVEV